ncbi:MAG: TetR/AcrR family transcriptional regulator [Treponema sp.]|nr:TetR/AcrR family transcriptional regulator [Treponema sp.]
MAIVVEHEKRKREILEKALDIFVEEGYEDVTFQKIADRCGITRTTLYIYFKNKREIFLWSIKQLLSGIESSLVEIVKDDSLDASQCLRKVCDKIVDYIEENRKLFYVLLTYLIQLKKAGGDVENRVQRRVIKLRHLITAVYIKGEKKGVFKKIPVKAVNEMIYALFESAIFRISVIEQKDCSEIRNVLTLAIDGICTKNTTD